MNDTVRPTGSDPPAERRLAAILHADVAGYSRLMGVDEAGTHARLMAARKVIDGHLATHGGRVAGTAGDAVLAVFDSIVSALDAALAIQTELAEVNAPIPADKRLVFRIGLNIGDVIVDRGDVFGAGVNVAARIEALADPGGIAVSGAVRDQVGTRLAVQFIDRGTHRLKNIDDPVQVFAVVPGAAAAASAPPKRMRRGLWWAGLVAGAVVLAVVATRVPTGLPPAGPATETPSPAATTRPVIAVLPFAERGGSDGETYFADGVTEEVIGALGRFSGLVVLSYSAVAPFRDQAPTPAEVRAQLGAGYVVSGSIHRAQQRIRVTVQLSNAADGALIWSDRYNEDMADVFAVQDRITRQVVAALTVRVTEVERARAAAVPTESLSAYDSLLRAREAMRGKDRAGNVQARALIERALQLDPGYADAEVELGWSHLDDLKYGWTQWPDRALDAAGKAADRAIALDPQNAAAHALQSDVRKFRGDFAGAEQAIDRALDLNPNSAVAHTIRSSLMVFTGRPDLAVEAAETALLLDPYPGPDQVMSAMVGNYLIGRFAEVRDIARRHADAIGDDPTPLAVLAAALAMLGEDAEARATADRVRRHAPFFVAADFVTLFGTPDLQDALLQGLRRAGFE